MKAQIVRHGEILLKPISEIPKEAKLIKTGKEHIVAHSETGHYHVLEVTNLRVYELDNELYLDVPSLGQLVHKKTGVNTHAPHTIVPAKYKVIVKKVFNYFSKILERVRD